MAGCDYRHCDVCDRKAFYDAELNYNDAPEGSSAFRTAGKEPAQYMAQTLDHVGDWAVICKECAKTHRCVIEKIVQPHPTESKIESGDAE